MKKADSKNKFLVLNFLHRKKSVDTFQKCLQPIRFVIAIALPTQKMTHKWNDGHQESFAIEIKKEDWLLLALSLLLRGF